MPFEIKPADVLDETAPIPRAIVLSDDDWRNVVSLARRHGFDPGMECEDALFPTGGPDGLLTIAAAQELAVALSEALREETAPGGEGEAGIRVGPPDEPALQVEWATVRSVGEAAEFGPVTVTRRS